MKNIRAFIFDFGKVFVGYDHMIAVRKISKLTGVSVSKVKQAMLNERQMGLFESAKISEKQFWNNVGNKLKIKMNDKTMKNFDKIWCSMFSPINKEMIGIAKNLRKKHKMLLLSNTIKAHSVYMERAKKFFKTKIKFNHVVFSYDVKTRKPESKIFNLVLRKLNVRPNEAVYLDDKIEFITAAKRMGINAFQFKSPSQLKCILKRLFK